MFCSSYIIQSEATLEPNCANLLNTDHYILLGYIHLLLRIDIPVFHVNVVLISYSSQSSHICLIKWSVAIVEDITTSFKSSLLTHTVYTLTQN